MEKELLNKNIQRAGEKENEADHLFCSFPFSIRPLLLTEVGLLWLISHSVFFLLIGRAEGYRPPENAHSYFKDSFYSEFRERSHCSPLWKHFNEPTDRWSSKEQGSIAGKWAPELSAPFIQYSPSQVADRVWETEQKEEDVLSRVYTGISVSHWLLFKLIFTAVVKLMIAVLQWCNVCCINNPWDKHFYHKQPVLFIY